jgi:nucleotide-binding universal stress UspA family protein
MPILAAVDFDACSRAALAVARELANVRDAELVVVHVVTAGSVGSAERLAMRAAARGVSPDEFALENAARQLEDFLRGLGPPTRRERTRVEVGAPAERIREVVTEERASTVVIGTHGRGQVGHALFGSVARDVMSKLSCRVVAVHEPAPAESP